MQSFYDQSHLRFLSKGISNDQAIADGTAAFVGVVEHAAVIVHFRRSSAVQVIGGLTPQIRKQLGEGFHYIICFGGALVAETIFSYPGLGMSMYAAINSSDYPVISACTLIITIMVLIASFLLDIIYAFIDPRVKAAQFD